MADETNTVLKHFQIYRNNNVSVLGTESTHATAVANAKTKFAELTGLLDGELVLYRYKLVNESTIHTIVGVHYLKVEGDNSISFYEILGNYDQLTAEYKAYVDSAIADLDSNAVNANGDIKVKVSQVDGKLSAVEVTDTLATVAHSGAAADVSIADGSNLFTAENVEGALTEVMTKANALQAAQLTAGTGIDIEGTTINADLKLSIAKEGDVTYLYIKDTEGAEISKVDAAKFVKDGFLQSVTKDAKNNTLVFTWNTDAGVETTTIAISDLCDVYTAKQNDWIQLNSFEFSHKTQSAFTQVEGQDAPQTTFGANAADVTVNNTESQSFKVPTLTVDAAGHVTAASEKTITITLPAEINTAIQKVEKAEGEKYLKVTRLEDSNDVTISTITGSVSNNDDKLAVASDVKTYVDGKIDGLDTPEEGVTDSNNGVSVTVKQVDGVITTVSVNAAELNTVIESLEGRMDTAESDIDALEGAITDMNYTHTAANTNNITFTIYGTAQNAGQISEVEDGTITFNQALSTDNKAATMADVNAAIESTTYTAGNGIAIANNQISADLKIAYDSTSKKITLKDNAGTNSFGEIDATDFIKDGMLEDVEIITATNEEGLTPGNKYFKFTFKTVQHGTEEATTTVEYLDVESLVDSYTAGNDWISIDQTTNKISHKTQTGLPESSIGSGSFANNTLTLSIPTLTVDGAGHVTALQGESVKMTLPDSIASAVQKVTSTEVLGDNKFVAVHATRGENSNDVVLTSEVKIGDYATESQTNGLATTSATKTYVDGQITTAIDALEGTATIASVTDNVVTLKAGIVEADGKIDNNTEADITLAKLATTGDAADVAISNAGSLYTAENVEDALAEVMTKANALQAAQLSAGKGIDIDGTTINADLKLSIAKEGDVTYLYIKDTEGAEISKVDAAKFVKDGFLQSVTKDAKNNTLVFTWNTDAGVETTTIAISDLCDVYTADETYLHLEGYKFEHKTITNLDSTNAHGIREDVTVNSTDTKTFQVPTLKVDAAGHVTTVDEKTVTITLPAEIDTAIQSGAGVNTTYITTTVARNTTNTNQLDVTVAAVTGKVADGEDKLATALDVKEYVNTKVGETNTAITNLDATLTPDTTINTETANVIKVSLKQEDGLIKDLALEVSDTWDAGTY